MSPLIEIPLFEDLGNLLPMTAGFRGLGQFSSISAAKLMQEAYQGMAVEGSLKNRLLPRESTENPAVCCDIFAGLL